MAIDAHAVDAVPDAPEPLTLTSAMGPVSLDAEGATGSVAVHVHTLAPAQAVDVVFTSSLGATYTPPTVTVTTDASGNATAASTYTSNMAGMEMTSIAGSIASMSSATASVAFPVVALQRYGHPTAFTTSGGFSPNYLLGEKITVAAPGHLKAFGFISMAVGPNIQIGLYLDAGGAPGALFTSLPSTPIQNGVNEVQVAPLQLDAGDYWFEADYSALGSVGQDQAGAGDVPIDYISFTFGGSLPATFPAPTTYNANHFNYYLVVGQ